ncbi:MULTISPECIES: helix-turn-helix domain-containing protein [Streptomyces]|uniref:helix-turn-helix domain-containing protein n=1 Tax=Streptomyces TaxID=1883 RepID=UPI00085319A4|nr:MULTISPECIES: helix-turn-helix transcriptional regulator [unclassified Streptomyces]MCD9591653.1 helix-turn-helix domain-containing protein [Streptomyces sp. 8ZJF_21]
MVASDLPIGDRIRHYRGERRQDVVAGLVGITPDYLSQIERGLKVPSLPILHAIAQELGVPTAALLADTPAPSRIPPDTAEPAIVRALMGYGPPRDTPLAEPAALRGRVDSAWRVWQSSRTRFTDMADALPDLIADTEYAARTHGPAAHPGRHRSIMRVRADLYFLLRSYLRRTGRVDLSMVAADRALRAAEEADDPLRTAAAQWNLGHVLLAAQELDGAEQIALRAVEELRRAPIAEPGRVAMSGALHLVAVVAEARRRDWSAARDRLRNHAHPAARSVGEGNIMWTVFGPTNVALHEVSIEMEAGDASEALRVADDVDTKDLPSMERSFTFNLEVARCHNVRREDAAVLLSLLELEDLAPEDLARTPLARKLMLTVIRRGRATHARQAEKLAERVGVF